MQSDLTELRIGAGSPRLQASSWTRSVTEVLAILLFYTTLTILFFWSVIHQIEFRLIGPPEDNLQDLWNLWYAAAGRGSHFFYTDLIKFPEGTSLYYHSFAYPMVFVGAFLARLFGAHLPTLILVQNSLLLASFLLAAVGAFYLVRHLVDNTAAALLGGFIFAFNPSHVAHVMHHAHVSSIEFIPFFILFYLRALERRHAMDTGAAILFYVLSALSSIYYLFYIAFFIAFHSVYLSLHNRAWPKGWDAICPSLILGSAALLLSPLLVPMLMEAAKGNVVYVGGHNLYVGDLAAYLAFPPTHALSKSTEWVYRRLTGNSWEATVYLGLANLALLAWAFGRCRAAGDKGKLLGYALWGMAVFCVFASGTRLHILGIATIPLPEAGITITPVLRNLRTPSRAIVLVYAFMAIGVAYAYDMLWRHRRTGSFPSWVPAAAVATLIAFDFYPMNLVSSRITCSPGWAVIRDDPDKKFGILDLPSGYEQGNAYMAQQLCHGRPIAQGNTSRDVLQSLRDRLETADLLSQKNQLTINRVKYIVIHQQPADFFQWPSADGEFGQYLQTYKTVYKDNELTILEVY